MRPARALIFWQKNKSIYCIEFDDGDAYHFCYCIREECTMSTLFLKIVKALHTTQRISKTHRNLS